MQKLKNEAWPKFNGSYIKKRVLYLPFSTGFVPGKSWNFLNSFSRPIPMRLYF